MIIVSILELIGISLVIPFVTTLVDPSYIENKYILLFNEYIGDSNSKSLSNIFIIIILLFYLLKNLFVIYVVAKQTRYSMNLITLIRVDFFKRYLSQNYIEFIKKDHAELISNIMNVSATFGSTFIVNLLIFVSEFLIVLSLTTFLLLFNFTLTISLIFVFSVILFFYFKYISPKLKEAGIKRVESDQQIINYSKLSFQNMKELKLFNKENFFIKIFFDNAITSENSNYFYQVSAQYPRIGMEIFAILGICLLTVMMNFLGFVSTVIVTTLAFYGVAIFRILPSANKLMFSFQSIRFSKKTLNVIREELKKTKEFKILEEIKKEQINFINEIKVENLSFGYVKNNEIIKNLNFKIKKGDFIGIKGESGSGKTTLIDILMGLIEPSSGKVKVDNQEINNNFQNWRNRCGYVPQNISLMNDTICGNVAFGEDKKNIDLIKVRKSLQVADLLEFVDTLKDKEQSLIGENGYAISGGQRQRLAIARALYREPDIIFFDEATSALDKKTEQNLLKSINKLKRKITIIFVSHNSIIFDNCDNIIDLDLK
tara:strand:- start:10047 stop:11675 length:1629 start_codon:yes stop_codon:yes gene_type:complete